MKFSFLVCTLLFSVTAVSQKTDYLITANGDTITAQRIAIKSNSVIINNDGKTTVINIDNVRKINSSGNEQTLLHCILQVYTDDIMSLQIDATKPPSLDTTILLSEIYSTPKMNLYTAKDNMKSVYYFYKTPSDSVPVQLVVRYHLSGGFSSYGDNPGANRGDRSRVHVEEMKGYVNQLRTVMANCNKIPDGMWDVLSYRDFSFKQLIKRYNKCK